MNGEPRVPGWLADLGLKAGDYLCDSKLRWKRAMKSRCFSPVARVYACLGLHTMAFQQELAVKMEAGKRVPLTPTDIAAETGLQKQNVRPALLELQNCGLVSVKGSTKGRVELYAWAVPRDPQPVENGNSRHYHFGGATPELLSLLNRYKIRLPEGFVLSRDYLSTVEAAARNYQNAEMVLKSALKGNGAPHCIYKEERNERDIERNEEVGRSVGSGSENTDLPTDSPSPAELIPDPRQDPRFREIVAVVEAVAVPVIGESPTDEQYLDIHRRLKGASPDHFKERLEAKKARGKLNSVMVLGHLADDCANNAQKWKPPVKSLVATGAKKNFVESVTQEAARRLAKWGHL